MKASQVYRRAAVLLHRWNTHASCVAVSMACSRESVDSYPYRERYRQLFAPDCSLNGQDPNFWVGLEYNFGSRSEYALASHEHRLNMLCLMSAIAASEE